MTLRWRWRKSHRLDYALYPKQYLEAVMVSDFCLPSVGVEFRKGLFGSQHQKTEGTGWSLSFLCWLFVLHFEVASWGFVSIGHVPCFLRKPVLRARAGIISCWVSWICCHALYYICTTLERFEVWAYHARVSFAAHAATFSILVLDVLPPSFFPGSALLNERKQKS